MKSLFRGALVAALLASASAASAATLVFELDPVDGPTSGYSFRFEIDEEPTPGPFSFVPGTSFRINGTPFTYTRPNGQTFTETGPFDGPTFFSTQSQGGLSLLRLENEPIEFQQPRFFQDRDQPISQLYTGSEADPTLRQGIFFLSTSPRNSNDPAQPLTYRLTISPLAAPVPEPGTWMTMIAGMGLVGGLMRRRRGLARVRFV